MVKKSKQTQTQDQSPQPTEKARPWLLPQDTKGRMGPGLYLIATPIGNLGDMTLRALDTLAACDAVACEDTRVTGKLLRHYGLKKPLWPYHDHNEAAQISKILAAIKAGQRIALVSDAGTPLISDPGYRLAVACRAESLAVTSLPGANAPLTALQLSGLPSDRFCFIGFLPSKQEACRKTLKAWADSQVTLIAFESPVRLMKTLALCAAELPGRPLCVARELTKLYEEARTGLPDDLLRHYEAEGAPRGEVVLVIAPQERDESAGAENIEGLLVEALKKHSLREAVAIVAKDTGARKTVIYEMALALQREQS